MTTHVLSAVSEDEQSVKWACSVCFREINFAKEGWGEPHANMFSFPENVDEMMDPCPGRYTGLSRIISRNELLSRITTEEIGALSQSADTTIAGLVFRLANEDPVDLANPRWLSDFSYAEGQNILSAGRSEVICQ